MAKTTGFSIDGFYHDYGSIFTTLTGEKGKSDRQLDPNHVIENLWLPDEVLSQPFSRLDNQAVRLLAQALIGGFK